MIVCVSIVDKHKPSGKAHVGTILFDIPEVDASASHYDLMAVPCEPRLEKNVREHYPIGKLLDTATVERLDAEAGKKAGSEG